VNVREPAMMSFMRTSLLARSATNLKKQCPSEVFF
jgi:hypothetical protein